jgi:hypothetical protein
MRVLPVLIFSTSGNTDEVPSWAKEKTPVKIAYYLGGGTSIPTGEMSNVWNLGFHGFGRLEFIATPKLSVWAGVDYHYFSFQEQSDSSVDGHNLNSIQFTGDLKVNLASPEKTFNPYFFIGALLAITRISDSTYRIYGDTLVNRGSMTYDTHTGGLAEFGAGLEYKKLFFQCRIINTSSKNDIVSYIPVTFGVRFK